MRQPRRRVAASPGNLLVPDLGSFVADERKYMRAPIGSRFVKSAMNGLRLK
jgi:hypothetical protein